MGLQLSRNQLTALGFSGLGGAMTGLIAGIVVKKDFPETSSGGRALAGILVGGLVGVVSALLPTMILFGDSGAPAATSGLGRHVVHPQLTTFRYPV